MIKLVQCVRKQEDLELLEFRRYWEEYRKLLEDAREKLGISRVLFSTTLAVEDNLEVMLARGTRVPYDGIVEIFFENATVLKSILADPKMTGVVEQLQEFQEEFMDLAGSTFFFAKNDEYV